MPLVRIHVSLGIPLYLSEICVSLLLIRKWKIHFLGLKLEAILVSLINGNKTILFILKSATILGSLDTSDFTIKAVSLHDF